LRALIRESFGKLYNQHGEILAEGSCQVDEERGSVTMRPLIDTPLLVRQEGSLRLSLDEGDELPVSNNVIRFRLNVPGVPSGPAYRLFIQRAPDQRRDSSAG
jgi:hypothetical protein